MSSFGIDKLIISGFIRRVFKQLIPEELVELCITYYVIKEKLKINSICHKKNDSEIHGINDDIFFNNRAKCICNVVGNISLKSCKHHWRFEILKIDNFHDGHDIQLNSN